MFISHFIYWGLTKQERRGAVEFVAIASGGGD
jgi:hypothetical protein